MGKKVILCGATHGTNFGDFLFASLFKETINTHNNEIEIFFARGSRFFVDKLNMQVVNLKYLLKADALIYVSGGYFGQSPNEDFLRSIHRFITYFAIGIFMACRRKPIAIIGVGAGPLKRLFLRKSAVYIFNRAKVITVRDEESKRYMEDYGVHKEIEVTSDTAQVIESQTADEKYLDKPIDSYYNVLVHCSGMKPKYRELIMTAIRDTMFHKPNIRFFLSSDQKYNISKIEEIAKYFPQDRTTVLEYDEPLELLNVINTCDAVITSKLHVGIMGCTFGKSVLSFPSHPEKTLRYYRDIGYPERSIPITEVSIEKATSMIQKYLYEKIDLPTDVRKRAGVNFARLHEFLESI